MKCPNCDIDLIKRAVDPKGVLHCPLCPFNCGPNDKKAEYLYACLSRDKNGMEGIIATHGSGDVLAMPMVSMKREMISNMVTPEFKRDLRRAGVVAIIAKFKRVEEGKC